MLARLRRAADANTTSPPVRLAYGERTLPATEDESRLLLRVEEVAQLLSVSRKTVYDLMHRRELASFKIGGCRRISVDAVHTFIASLEAAA